ncbi:MAG: sigma 54-interacting transcriptional regulator [Candidatus Latescibacteria bacterium]|jgi:sigma-54 dependent transcriptional regulator, acetoin dehydrogenase operon transcriptional activator AcoR|nr:sigma 54-interacting transcriptional regulator [Candidatus Latescibacterota bacterium]
MDKRTIIQKETSENESRMLSSRILLTHALKLMNAPLVVEERLELLARIIADYLSVDDVAIFLKETDADELVLRASVGLGPIAVGNLRVPIGQGVTGTVAKTRKYIATRNILKDPRNYYSVYSEDEKFPSVLSFPILSGEELIGVVNIRSEKERDFTEVEAVELNNFTASIAGAIKNAQAHEWLEYKSRLLELSIKIAGTITSTLDLDVIMEEVAWEIANGFSIKGVVIHLMDEEGNVTKTSTYGVKTSFIKKYPLDVARNCVLTGEPKISRVDMGKHFGDEAYHDDWNICLPLSTGKKTLGAVSLFGIDDSDKNHERQFLTIGVDALLHIAGLAALAFENASIHSELKRIAEEEKGRLNTIETMYSRISAIFDSILEGVIAVNRNGIMYDFNEVARKSLGLKKSDKGAGKIDTITSYKPPLSRLISEGKEFTDRVVSFAGSSEQFAAMVTMRSYKDTSGEQQGSVISFRPMEETVKMLSRFTSQRPRYTFDDIIGNKTNLKGIVRLARLASQGSSNILICGESGTGKELFSQAIHNASPVADGPFIPVNCAAIPKDLIESELFGYNEGAFTGARKGGYIGKFEQATGGSIFLDEIGDMPLDLQVKLLRVLQEKVLQRIGSEHIIPISTRVIAATNHDLKKAITEGGFREELYWRLNVITIDIPPLRERKENIPEFLKFFIKQFSQLSGKDVKDIDPDVMEKLMIYPWRGNIRELENAVEHAILVARSPIITWDDIPANLKVRHTEEQKTVNTFATIEDARKERTESSLKLYREALIHAGGDVDIAANNLGISRATMYRRLKKYGLMSEIVKLRHNIKNDTET